MIINSKAHGTVRVEDKQIFHFSQGILGFENVKDFALLDAGQPPFMWLQSIEVTNLAFVVLEPNIFREDYDPSISIDDLKAINFKGDNYCDLLVLSIVTIPENQNEMTANLQGPVILNKLELLGKQFISPDDKWTTRHNIMEELAGKRATKC